MRDTEEEAESSTPHPPADPQIRHPEECPPPPAEERGQPRASTRESPERQKATNELWPAVRLAPTSPAVVAVTEARQRKQPERGGATEKSARGWKKAHQTHGWARTCKLSTVGQIKRNKFFKEADTLFTNISSIGIIQPVINANWLFNFLINKCYFLGNGWSSECVFSLFGWKTNCGFLTEEAQMMR